jgi:hypothetical protein
MTTSPNELAKKSLADSVGERTLSHETIDISTGSIDQDCTAADKYMAGSQKTKPLF